MQPWSQALTLAEAGKGCDGLFGLYDSLGDATLLGASTIATLLDGPEKVVRYGALTLGDGTTVTSFTASNRCKGLTVLCDSLTVKANATLHMTGRGARVLTSDDPFFPFDDYKIPFRIALASSRLSLAQALSVIKGNGLAPWDRGTFQSHIAALYGFDLSVSLAGATALMVASGCGLGGAYRYSAGVSAGSPGLSGANGGMGGGGGGGTNWISGDGYIGRAGAGCPYSGGSGGGGSCHEISNNVKSMPTMYSGPGGKGGRDFQISNMSGNIADNVTQPPHYGGGGAGNPGGIPGSSANQYPGENGCGGKLTIICRGAITVQSGGKIEANGMKGGASQNYGGGGGSGGGHISIISPGAVSNAGTIQAAGGVGGANGGTDGASVKGGDGGAGSVVTRTFSDMGW